MFEKFIRPLLSRFGHLSILIGVILLFALGLLPSSTIGVFIKIVIFLVVLALAYLLYQQTEAPHSDHLPSEAEDQTPDLFQMEKNHSVEESFENFLENTLLLIKKVLVADTIILLFANYSKKQFVIRYSVSTKEDALITGNNFDLYKGLPSLVLRNRAPLIENHLPGRKEILPYYQNEENKAQSFAAVPIYFNDLVIGVLCADTTATEAFSNDDVEILKLFGNLITAQLVNSNKLYEYETENWVASVLFEISQEINQIRSTEDLWSYLSQKIPEVIPCDRISVARKLDGETAEIVSLRGGTGNVKVGKIFSLTEGITGWVIRKNQSLMVDDFSEKEKYVPRFFVDESPAKEYFSLLAVPIPENREALGVICLESNTTSSFNEQQKRILSTIANQAATVLKTTETLENLKRLNYRDPDTNLNNINAFQSIIPGEIKRSHKLGLRFNLLYVKIYYQLKEDENDLHRKTVNEFLSLVLPHLSDVDYIFRLYSDTFAIAQLQRDGDGLQNLATELIEKVKMKKVWAEGNAFDFYVNMGIIDGKYLTPDVEDVLQKGKIIIKQARMKGPNQLSIYYEHSNGNMTDKSIAGEADNE